MSVVKYAHAAIRHTEGRDWIDNATISCDFEESQRVARETDTRLPGWAQANRIVRFVKVEIREV